MPNPTTARENGKRGGRPQGTLNPETIKRNEMRQKMLERIEQEFQPLMDAAMDLAKGVVIYVPGKDGKKSKVYEQKPDADMVKYLLDQSAGKALTSVEMSGGVSIDNLQDFIYSLYGKSANRRNPA
jgi:vancomycin resistance protein YoaR